MKDGKAVLSVPCSNAGSCDLKIEDVDVGVMFFANGFSNRLNLKKIKLN